jgi:hypothetical protein
MQNVQTGAAHELRMQEIRFYYSYYKSDYSNSSGASLPGGRPSLIEGCAQIASCVEITHACGTRLQRCSALTKKSQRLNQRCGIPHVRTPSYLEKE